MGLGVVVGFGWLMMLKYWFNVSLGVGLGVGLGLIGSGCWFGVGCKHFPASDAS